MASEALGLFSMGQPVRLGLYKLVALDLPKSELVSGDACGNGSVHQHACKPPPSQTLKATPVEDFFGDFL